MICVFDLFGVVVKWGSGDVVPQWAEYCNVSEDVFRSETRPDFRLCETGKIPLNEFWSRIGKKFGVEGSGLERIFISSFKKRARLDKGVINLVKHLPFVALLSNQFPLHSELCMKNGWLDFFNRVFVSYEIGYLKPDVRAYKAVLKELKVEPDDVVFVDDKAENVSGAVKAGMSGIVFRGAKQLKLELGKFFKLKGIVGGHGVRKRAE